MQVKTTFNECHGAIGKLRSVRKQIKDKNALLNDKSGQDSLIQEGKEIIKKLTALEDKLIQTKSESGQDPINYPSMIDDQIAYLYSVVNGNEDKPTKGAYLRYRDLKADLEPLMKELDGILDGEVNNWGKLLEAQTLDGILWE